MTYFSLCYLVVMIASYLLSARRRGIRGEPYCRRCRLEFESTKRNKAACDVQDVQRERNVKNKLCQLDCISQSHINNESGGTTEVLFCFGLFSARVRGAQKLPRYDDWKSSWFRFSLDDEPTGLWCTRPMVCMCWAVAERLWPKAGGGRSLVWNVFGTDMWNMR